MAFHSFAFIFGALPLIFCGFALAHRIGGWQTAFRFLGVASLAYYAQFGLVLVSVLLVSVVVNYGAGELIIRSVRARRRAGVVLASAIAANLGALVYFKYTNFLIDIANTAFGSEFSHAKMLVPVGVSFFTFIQIGYLIECYNDQVERPGFGKYLVFATFFPCVTAGPLVLQRELFDQMGDRKDQAFDSARIAAGLTMFLIGLFKKVVIADSVAPFADPVFVGVAQGLSVDTLTAWMGALCYTLQLYFDFSGYSDMAVGLGCIFGLKLPLNFDSPFKQSSISDFWRGWHITMTRYFTNFIYTPLAMRGMRRSMGSGRFGRVLSTAVFPAIATFLVAGVWHGAGWTFVVYGLLHGAAIAINLAWREFSPVRLPAAVGWVATMAVVVTGLVIFRAESLHTAGVILSAMWFGAPLTAQSVTIELRMAAALVVLLGSIVLLMPNSQTITSRFWVSSDVKPAIAEKEAGLLLWSPTAIAAVCMGLIGCVAIGSVGASSTFLYYSF